MESGDDPVAGVCEELGCFFLKDRPGGNEDDDDKRGNKECPDMEVKPEYPDIVPSAPVGAPLVNL